MTENEMQQKIEVVAQKLELRQIEVVKFLKLATSRSGYTSKELIRKMGFPQTHLYKLIHEFTDILEPKTRQIVVKKELFDELNNYIKKIIYSTDTINRKLIKKIIQKYQNIRPAPNRDLDQFTATTSTTVKRVAKLAKYGDLKNKEIAFLGDDDLVSVGVALAQQCKKITVFEIDDRITKLIAKISEENNLNIEIINHDLRQSLSPKYFHNYDLVFTDPPYTKEGINIFLNQAVSLIKKNFLGRIYLCYGNSDRAREREVEIQKLILDHHLLIKNKFNQFNQYFGAESIGSRSSLYVLDWTPGTKIIKSDLKKIYTND